MKMPSQKKRVIKRVGKSVDTNMDVYRQRMKKLSLKPKKMNKMILKAMNKREVEAIENEVVVEVRGAREKDDEEKDCVCFYCSRVHTRVMMKNHQRDEADLGMKLDITSCSALCCALDLRGMPPASPMHGRKGFERFFS